MKRKIGMLVLALVAVAAVGVSLGAGAAEAAPGLQAHPGGSYAGVAGVPVHFDGTLSGGIGLSYHWTFGDGTAATGARPVKTYAAAGVYTVTLTVRDYTGALSSASTTAVINGTRVLVPGGCYTTVAGGVVCGAAVSGCSLTVAGWMCPATATGDVAISSPVVYPGQYYPVHHCALPVHMHTAYCRMLDKS